MDATSIARSILHPPWSSHIGRTKLSIFELPCVLFDVYAIDGLIYYDCTFILMCGDKKKINYQLSINIYFILYYYIYYIIYIILYIIYIIYIILYIIYYIILLYYYYIIYIIMYIIYYNAYIIFM